MATAAHGALPASPAPPTVGDDPGQANKALRRDENARPHILDHDWISGLPDEMLIYILTLIPIKDAAIMGWVSSRWRNLWRHIPNLVLTGHSIGMQEPQNPETRAVEFIVKVNSILGQRHGTRIESFTVEFPLTSKHAPEVDCWIENVVQCGVKRLKLKLAQSAKHKRLYDFPLQFFDSGSGSTLREFLLTNCKLSCSPKFPEGFRSLTCLLLYQVSVADVAIMSILSTCNALDLLKLARCNELVHVRVSHAQLRHFHVAKCEKMENINIHAENLSAFGYVGHMVNVVYGTAPVLHTVRVHFIRCFQMTGNLCPLDCIGALPSLKKLYLQFVSSSMHSLKPQHYETFAGLRGVRLSFLTSWNQNIVLVANLLIAAPLIKKLQLEAYNELATPKNLTIIWPEHASFRRLHKVTVGGFSGETEMMELTSFLLRRSPALKTLKIDTHRLQYQCQRRECREVAEDPIRCYYARGMALTHLAPKVPSTVKFTIE